MTKIYMTEEKNFFPLQLLQSQPEHPLNIWRNKLTSRGVVVGYLTLKEAADSPERHVLTWDNHGMYDTCLLLF